MKEHNDSDLHKGIEKDFRNATEVGVGQRKYTEAEVSEAIDLEVTPLQAEIVELKRQYNHWRNLCEEQTAKLAASQAKPPANDVRCPENEPNATTAEESGIRSAGNIEPTAAPQFYIRFAPAEDQLSASIFLAKNSSSEGIAQRRTRRAEVGSELPRFYIAFATAEEQQTASTILAKAEPSDAQLEKLVSKLGTAAALFTMEYNEAKASGRNLDHGIDVVIRKILYEELNGAALAQNGAAELEKLRHGEQQVVNNRGNCQPFEVCPVCWHAMAYTQVHDRATDKCPKCSKGEMVVIEQMNIPSPAIGCHLLCLVCAFYKPWGIFDCTTGAAVCIECRDKARAALARDGKGETDGGKD